VKGSHQSGTTKVTLIEDKEPCKEGEKLENQLLRPTIIEGN